MCDSCGCKPLARSRVYEFVAAGFSSPDAGTVGLLQGSLPEVERCLATLEGGPPLEAFRALAPVLAPCSLEGLANDYVQCFGHTISSECPPYEAEYGQSHIFQKSQTLADIAGFYQAFGLELAADLNDRADHLSVELEFMHFLCLKEAYGLVKGHPQERLTLCRAAQARFLEEHLGEWAFGFLQRLEQRAGESLYGRLGRLLQGFLALELRRLGVKPGQGEKQLSSEPSAEEEAACEPGPVLAPGIDPLSIAPRE